MMFYLFLNLFFVQGITGDLCQLYDYNSKSQLFCSDTEFTQTKTAYDSEQMQVLFSDGFKLEITVKDINGQRQKFFDLHMGDRKKAALTTKDKWAIQQAVDFIQSGNLSEKFFLIRFFDMLPVGESLHPLFLFGTAVTVPERDNNLPSSSDSLHTSFRGSHTMICEYIGKRHFGTYQLGDETFIHQVTVGDRESQCYGRCGFGCGWRDYTYTQECLNHDVCHRSTGDNLGVCTSYFLDAVDGYLFGNSCR